MQRELLLPSLASVSSAADARRIDIDIVRSARRRSMAIHVSPQGQVEVRVPLRVSAPEISAFLERHRDWVLRKVGDAERNPPWQPQWQPGGEWFWRGERVSLASAGPRGGCLLDGQLALPLRADDDAARWQRAVLLWHRRAAGAMLDARARELFSQHCAPHRLARVEFRWMRVTWGTCGGKRGMDKKRDVVLRLNPWLASLPPSLCDAILLHELAHVEHMNHGAAFYRRLSELNPAWREHDRELRPWARRLLPLLSS